jgi:SAM-dependent methyltransferase
MIDRDWYKAWFNSPYYHKLYFERDEDEAKKFISRLLDHLKPPDNSRMLDAACGRGRHSRILASKGYDVTGIDLSPASIAFAKQFETTHLHFYQHDMRLPFWINYFDYAFNFYTSFGYFATRREHENAMRTISDSLCPNGFFLIDYLNVHFVENHLIADEVKNMEGTQYIINRWQDEDHFYKKIKILDASLIQPLEFTEKVAKFSLGDFTDMLSYQHIQICEVYGSYDLQPYHVRNTPRLIILGQKIKR